MPIFIRKALRFGPVRFNLSKSGIGTSIGVRGLRVGQTATGHGYIFGGRSPFYFRESIGSGRHVGIAPGAVLLVLAVLALVLYASMR